VKPTKTKPCLFFGRDRILTLVLAIFVFGPSATTATIPPAASDTLSLTQCVTIACANSLELKKASNAIDVAGLDRSLAAKARWPQLRFVGGAGYAPYSLDFGYDPAVSNGGELGARLVAEQTVYNGGIFSGQIKQADIGKSLTRISWQQTRRDLEFEVRQAFIELLMTEQKHDFAEKNVTRLTDFTDLATALNKSGAVGYTDVLNSRMELARAQIDAETIGQDVSSARLNLGRLLGYPNADSLVVDGSLENLLIDAADTVQSAPRMDTTNNVDLEAMRLDYAQNRLALDMTRAQWKPKVGIAADAGVMTSRDNLLANPADRYNSIGYSVGINIEMPVFDWGNRSKEVAKSRIELKSAEDNIGLIRREIIFEYNDNLNHLTNARKRLSSIQKVLETAENNYLLNKAQYANGAAVVSDVIIAAQALSDTRQSEIETLAEIQIFKARLDKITRSKQDDMP